MRLLALLLILSSSLLLVGCSEAERAAKAIERYDGQPTPMRSVARAIRTAEGREAVAAAALANELVAFNGDSRVIFLDRSGDREWIRFLDPEQGTLLEGFAYGDKDEPHTFDQLRFEEGELHFVTTDPSGTRRSLLYRWNEDENGNVVSRGIHGGEIISGDP